MTCARLSGVLLALICSVAQGALSLSGTRLIFDGRYDEATIDVSNRSDSEALIQAWLDVPHEGSEPQDSRSVDLPFALTPHLARVPAQGKQTLRLLYEGVGMPRDRESMLHLFVLAIPRRSELAQQLSIALRHRINVFYRPAGLSGDPADAAQMLIWQRVQGADMQLSVRNPTPYHVSLLDVRVGEVSVADYRLLPPFSGASLALPADQPERTAPETLHFNAMTDYGGQRYYCAPFQGWQPFTVPLHRLDSHSRVGKC
jgi:P pilus assembly chaperone PapD